MPKKSKRARGAPRVPEYELWLHQPKARSDLRRALAWAERRANLITLSKRDTDVFFRALVKSPAATPAFKKAAKRFAEKFDLASQRIKWSRRPQR